MVRKLFANYTGFLNFGIQERVLHSKGRMIFPSSEGKERGGFSELQSKHAILSAPMCPKCLSGKFAVRCSLFVDHRQRKHVTT